MNVESNLPHHGVILLDPDRLFREALAHSLRCEKFEVVQIAGSPSEVSMERLAESDYRILVTNVEEGDEDILEFLVEAKKVQPKLKIMVVTRSESPATVHACINAGVHAYLSKNISSVSFQNYLLFVALDEKVLPIEIAESLRPANPYPSPLMLSKTRSVDFSPREHAILKYLIQGASNKVIARHLGIADGTVKVGVKMILRKIDATNRTQAAIWALQHDSCGSFLAEIKDQSDEDTAGSSSSNGHENDEWRETDNVLHNHIIRFEDVATTSR